jgi:acetyl-CoA carboxylase biotin carboxyl carrier protein
MDKDTNEQHEAWVERVENLIHMLQGSSVSELELREAGMEINIRRQPGMMLVSAPAQQLASASLFSPGAQLAQGQAAAPAKAESGVAIVAPLVGVYYGSPSPSSPPFVSVGDIVQVGQVVALVEAMKVFNEIQAEVSGRVSALVAKNGEVVQKGEALIRVVPV